MSAAVLAALAATDVRESIAQDQLVAAMTSSPFVYVPGTFNTRDLGLVPSSDDDGSSGSITNNKLRPGFAFRSGALDGLRPEGAALLASRLGVRRIFDLRSEGERGSAPDPDVPGVENTWSATAEKEATADLPDFVDGGGEAGYEKMYLDVLHVYREPFRAVLEHVRDRPQEPFLFHCTAGRDRTGVLSGIINALAGQDPAVAELDYMLSRVGTEPARDMLLAFVMKGTGAASTEEPGLYNLVSLRPSSWRAFVDAVARQYEGGFHGYARQALGFSDEDLQLIKRNLSRDWKP